ncbi:MAG: hypothetical protein HDT43_09020 [Ruminococcaceae bacterium]|nr:hypothetical protein [Oscillospiraceae bacterium]
MIRALKCDFNKTLLSGGFWSAVFVTFLLCFTENVYVDGSTMQAFSALEALFRFDRTFMERYSSFCSLSVFKDTLSGYSAMFLPILASFPFVFSHCAERNSGNIRFSIFRGKRLKYYFSKFICAVLSGGLCVTLGVMLYGIFSFFAFPGIERYPYLDLEFYAPNSIPAEIVRKLLSSFIYGCVNTVPAFFLSAFCRNRYMILCVPFLLRFIQETAVKKILVNSRDDKVYQAVFPFEPYAPSRIPYLETDVMLYSTIAVTVISAALMLLGYIIIMECRTDKGE